MNEMPVMPTEEQPKKNNTPMIIAIVVLVLLCCCCIGIFGGVWLWNNGDALLSAAT